MLSIPKALAAVDAAIGPERAAEQVAETVTARSAVPAAQALQVYVDLQGWRDLDGETVSGSGSEVEQIPYRALYRIAHKGALLLAYIHFGGDEPSQEEAATEADDLVHLAGLCGLEGRVPDPTSDGGRWLLSVPEAASVDLDSEPDNRLDEAAQLAVSRAFLTPAMAWQAYTDLDGAREFDHQQIEDVAVGDLPYQALYRIAHRLLTQFPLAAPDR